MGMRLSIKGDESIILDEHQIIKAEFLMDSPNDANARATDVVNTIKIWGKILTPSVGAIDDTIKIARWSGVRAEVADSYREVNLKVISEDIVVRDITLPHAFVYDYDEQYGDKEGVGTFILTVRQRKDKFDDTKVEGGFPG